jgi:hypothetical protein
VLGAGGVANAYFEEQTINVMESVVMAG